MGRDYEDGIMSGSHGNLGVNLDESGLQSRRYSLQ